MSQNTQIFELICGDIPDDRLLDFGIEDIRQDAECYNDIDEEDIQSAYQGLLEIQDRLRRHKREKY